MAIPYGNGNTINCSSILFGAPGNSRAGMIFVGELQAAQEPASDPGKIYKLGPDDSGNPVLEATPLTPQPVRWIATDEITTQFIPELASDGGTLTYMLPWAEWSITWMQLPTGAQGSDLITAQLSGCTVYLDIYADKQVIYHANFSAQSYEASQVRIAGLLAQARAATGFGNPREEVVLTRRSYQLGLFEDDPAEIPDRERALLEPLGLLAMGQFASVYGSATEQGWNLMWESFENALDAGTLAAQSLLEIDNGQDRVQVGTAPVELV